MAQIQLTPHQIQDFEVIRDLHENLLKAVVQTLSQVIPPPLTPASLFAIVIEAFDGDKPTAECVMRQGLSLNGLMRQTGIDVDAVVQGIRGGIERHAEWSKDEIERWRTLEPTFRDLLSVDVFRIVAKSIELSYDFANLYRKGRILTDIRPLYSTDANQIVGAVVSYTLRLRYESDEGDHELSIAMDESDIHELLNQCNRALKKARTARGLMEGKAEIPTIITGERNDA